ncbi:IS5 family transposase [Nitrosomonas ureae]|uniref:Transposase DDE domain-containing protein n=3 Tax=Nitrosomonas ureae TaxID=44577 RepID=A0A286ACB3_9PROT|nr:IS5 family transposase [Nitrosomonas ureae]SOD19515.1 Transposase DDE domain-containing protein [Nitrosomonas ureae]
MIRYVSQKQLPLEGFDTPPGMILDPTNRWVKLRDCIPWDELSESYYKTLCSNLGRPAKDAGIVIGAVIIKHKLSVSDEETVEQIRENPYLQYFIGLKGFQAQAPFASSLLVEIRKRMGQTVFDEFHESIIETVEPRRTKKSFKASDDDNDGNDVSNSGDTGSNDAGTAMEADQSLADELPRNHGKLILDATVAEQAIRYPTDLGLLNEARELSERIIDELHAKSNRAQKKKPRTYREIARKAYLSLVKLRRPSSRKRRAGIRQQLQFLQRNLKHIEEMLTEYPHGTPIPIPNGLLRRYWVLPHLYQQQYEMYKTNTRRCDDRIVSISQPYIRPIIRGKQGRTVEFGAKISVSLTGKGLAHVDKLHWDAQHEGHDLEAQVEAYKKRYGYYPEVVIADTLYGSRDNRSYLARNHIRFAGKPLGRPPKITPENKDELMRMKAQRRPEYRERIPIEGKFGQGKYGYRLNNIRAKRADTSVAWINSIFLVMNLLILVRVFICLRNLAAKIASWVTKKSMPREIPFARACQFSSNRNSYLAAHI